MREVARSRQREDLPAIGEDDGVEACDSPATANSDRIFAQPLPIDHAEAVEDWLARGAEAKEPSADGAGVDSRVGIAG